MRASAHREESVRDVGVKPLAGSLLCTVFEEKQHLLNSQRFWKATDQKLNLTDFYAPRSEWVPRLSKVPLRESCEKYEINSPTTRSPTP